MNTADNRRNRVVVRNILCVALSMALYGAMPVSYAQSVASSESIRQYDVPAGSLSSALSAWGAQSDTQVVFAPEMVAGKQTGGVAGQYSAEQALTQLLADTGLTWERVDDSTYAVKSGSQSPPPETGAPARATRNPAPRETGAIPEPTRLDTITVAGTRIRGGTAPSPVVTIGSERMQQEGFSDLGDVIRNIPQNFNGGQNPGVTLGAAQGSPSNQNITGGSGMNLRGLGPDATLTLLNGRRMAYGGFSQSVDISAIPLEAVERIEVVPDGASAIYGSDAVGGVANVVLKRDFEGLTVGARHGGTADGGMATREYTVTTGTTWATGGLIAAAIKGSNDPIYSHQRDYTQEMYRPSTLWQGANLRSGLISFHQSLGGAAELRLDALRSERDIRTSLATSAVYNPYGAETKTTLLAPSLEIWLPGDWSLTFSGAMGKEKNSSAQPTVNKADGAVTAAGLAAYRNRSLTYELGAEGPLLTLPGGEARLAAGAGYRHNDFLRSNNNVANADGDQSSRFAYAELNLPLVGAEQGISGVERLVLTGAIRAEDGDYGRVTTPKLGVIYSPGSDFSLKASWGKSFKAPTLTQRYSSQIAAYYPASTFGIGYPADAAALWLAGGNVDLRPERARTWSASLAFHPAALTGLEAELTWFDIDYTERVLQPITTYDVYGNPRYVDFVTYDPSEAVQAEALAHISTFHNLVGTPYDPGRVVAIVDGRNVNAARQRVKGIDLSGSNRFDVGAGVLIVRGSVSWLDSTQALTAIQTPYDLAGTLFRPTRINSRIGAVWQQGGFAASLFGNYKSGLTNPADDSKGASFTTFDGTLRYATRADAGAAANMVFELAGRNLLNRAPPLYAVTSLTHTPYDSANFSAVGRYLSFSVSKHF